MLAGDLRAGVVDLAADTGGDGRLAVRADHPGFVGDDQRRERLLVDPPGGLGTLACWKAAMAASLSGPQMPSTIPE
jgi:hypothetical protein